MVEKNWRGRVRHFFSGLQWDVGMGCGTRWMDYFSNPGAVHGLAYRANAEKARELACEGVAGDCRLDIFSLDQSDPKVGPRT